MSAQALAEGATSNPATFWTVLGLGFVLGLRHALDPDHVVAVSTIVSRSKSGRSALRIGALWGLGHSVTILVVGGAIVAAGSIVPPRIEAALEFCVALMLMALGTLNLRDTWRKRRTKGERDASEGHHQRAIALRPIAIGVVHGVAGSAAIALLVLTTLESVARAILYLVVFGVGTTVGMALLTGAVVLPIAAATGRYVTLGRYMSAVTGLASLALGVVLAFELAGEIFS